MELTLNSAAQSEQLSGIREFTYLVRATPGAIGFTIGEPDLNTPEAVKQAAKAALDANDTHYPPGNGYPATLEAISAFEEKEHGLRYSANEVILTDGATEALFVSFATVLNPGDEVIIPTPAFGLYESIVRLCRGVPVQLPTEKNRFQIDPAALERAITPKTKAIILTSPNNPTGCIYTKQTLDQIHAVLADRPIFVTSAPAFLQAGCVQALQEDVGPVRALFKRRRDYMYGRLTAMGWPCQEPEGAFYIFVDISKWSTDSRAFAKKMLAEAGVGVIPGVFFDTEGYVRLSYCYSDAELKEGLDRMERFIKTL